jgi:hypothetical protein
VGHRARAVDADAALVEPARRDERERDRGDDWKHARHDASLRPAENGTVPFRAYARQKTGPENETRRTKPARVAISVS